MKPFAENLNSLPVRSMRNGCGSQLHGISRTNKLPFSQRYEPRQEHPSRQCTLLFVKNAKFASDRVMKCFMRNRSCGILHF